MKFIAVTFSTRYRYDKNFLGYECRFGHLWTLVRKYLFIFLLIRCISTWIINFTMTCIEKYCFVWNRHRCFVAEQKREKQEMSINASGEWKMIGTKQITCWTVRSILLIVFHFCPIHNYSSSVLFLHIYHHLPLLFSENKFSKWFT